MERFWEKVNLKDNDSCWEWTAFKTKRSSYGLFRFNGITNRAHRVSWIINNGPIPNGMHFLHKCDNPPCVNPAHLFLGTQKDNVEDCVLKNRTQRYNGKKTHCKYGHPYAGENLRINIYGHRVCKACARLARRKDK